MESERVPSPQRVEILLEGLLFESTLNYNPLYSEVILFLCIVIGVLTSLSKPNKEENVP